VSELPNERLRCRDVAVLLLAGLPFYLRLDHTLWGSESRWVFIASEMLTSGDWLEPSLRGSLYFDKPLLSYWAIVWLALPFGAVSETLARLPSALAGSATVLLTGWMAARLFGRRSAVFAGAILATSFSFVYWSRSTSADLLNLLFICAALALYVHSIARLRSWHLPLFFVLLAIGGHAKGTPAIIVPLAVAGADFVLARRWELLRRWPSALLGLGLAACVYAAPFLVSYAHRGDWQLFELMWRENFVRAFDPWDHTANVFYYFYTLPAMFLPWSLWLFGALGWAWCRRGHDRGLGFALSAFVVILLVFSSSESRRSYYILPAFPWAALLVAAFWEGMARAREARRTPDRVWRLLGELPVAIFACLMLGAACVAGVAAWLPGDAGALGRALPWRFALALPCGVAAAATWRLQRRGAQRAAFRAALCTAFCFFLYFATGIQALREAHATERPFAFEVSRRFPAHRVVYYRGGIGGSLQYYLGPGAELTTPTEIAALLTEPGDELVAVCGKAGPECLADTPEFTARRVFQIETPAIGSIVKPKYKYSLFVCRRR